jgi:hypothetical protein
VLVVRDAALHFRGIQKTHCENETAAFEQYKVGRSILGYAMDHLDPDSLMVLSYETLVTLRGSYMQELYKFLNIKSNYYHEMRMETFVVLPEALFMSISLPSSQRIPKFPSRRVIQITYMSLNHLRRFVWNLKSHPMDYPTTETYRPETTAGRRSRECKSIVM